MTSSLFCGIRSFSEASIVISGYCKDACILRKLGGTYIDEPSLLRKMSVSMRAGETRHQRLRRTGTHPAFLQCVVHVG